MSDLREQLRIIADEAPKMRKAGVVGRVVVGDVTFSLDAEPGEAIVDDDDDGDPLNDPATYGFRRGGKIPTLKSES